MKLKNTVAAGVSIVVLGLAAGLAGCDDSSGGSGGDAGDGSRSMLGKTRDRVKSVAGDVEARSQEAADEADRQNNQ